MINTALTFGTNPYENQPIGLFGSGTPFQVSSTQETAHTQQTATAFADNIALRLKQQAGTIGETEDAAENAEEKSEDASGLAASLNEAVQFIGDSFGDDAATAAMGIIYKRIGNNEITEDNLSDGLLDVLRFVDRNFGFEGGDKLINHFNGELNDSLNEYFDNGLTETFYAVTPQANTAVQALPKIVDTVQEQLGDEAADLVSSILEDSLEDGLSLVNIRKALAEAKNALNKDFAPGSASVLAHAANDALAGLGEGQEQQENLKGITLNVAV